MVGTFYPAGLPERDYLSYYATKFDTVEIDSTFYSSPPENTVRAWNARTPPGFIFAAKVPRAFTHDKVPVESDDEFKEFVNVMDNLGEKLGPLLLQFGYFHRDVFASVDEFLGRLRPFLDKLPKDHKFVVEIRNKHWLVPRFVDALREHGVALALIDQAWMPRPAQWFEKINPITAEFTYVRWLGDRKEIEARTKIWNKTIIDRTTELTEWAEVLGKLKIPIYVYANNHYAGYGPQTVETFRKLWRGPFMIDGIRSPRIAESEQRSLFE